MSGRTPVGVGGSWNPLAQCNSRRHSFFDGGLLSLEALVSCASESCSICDHARYLTDNARAGFVLKYALIGLNRKYAHSI